MSSTTNADTENTTATSTIPPPSPHPFPDDQVTTSDLRLTSMVNMIDSVTEEMTGHKERLAPDPVHGFRQPVITVDPDERPTTAPSMGAIARPSSPAPIR